MSAYDNEQTEDQQTTQVKFRFCKNCANLLYPTEDKSEGSLKFQCRHCHTSENAETACVFRNDLSNTVGETAGITQDVGADPTVGHAPLIFCTMCGEIIVCVRCGIPSEEGYLCLEVEDPDPPRGTQSRRQPANGKG